LNANDIDGALELMDPEVQVRDVPEIPGYDHQGYAEHAQALRAIGAG
jgi:hypothetical protein